MTKSNVPMTARETAVVAVAERCFQLSTGSQKISSITSFARRRLAANEGNAIYCEAAWMSSHTSFARSADYRSSLLRVFGAACLASLTVAAQVSYAQTQGQKGRAAQSEAVSWSVSASAGDQVKRGADLVVTLKGVVRNGWHIYGLERQSRGPLPLEVFLPKEAADAELRGDVIGSAPTTAFDAAFGFETQYYTDSFTVTVPVRLAADAAVGLRDIPISVQYQACDGTVCLLPKTIKLAARVNVR